jgi:hypothetical protein
VTVHIPNGVLPVSVLFMLLSIWFESSSLAAAAKYNLFFVTLAMPAVIVTGLGDWINRYGGRMTKVFSTKMVCAGIVTVMCITLSIWWLVQPDIYIGGAVRLGTFVIFHMVALVAAVVAGWYGGKLVFPKKVAVSPHAGLWLAGFAFKPLTRAAFRAKTLRASPADDPAAGNTCALPFNNASLLHRGTVYQPGPPIMGG